MESVLTRLPRYARGLRLVRIGVFVMLAQLVLSTVMSVKMAGASTPDDVVDAVKWVQYFLWANIAATGAMLIGTLLAIPDFRLARLPLGRVIVAASGFAIATAALWWTQHAIEVFVDVARDPEASLDELLAAGERLDSLGVTAVVKDVAYVGGLIAVLRMVRQSAIANDQLVLRDDASSVTGLLVLMMIGDLFYQLTYGLSGGVGVFPLVKLLAAIMVGGYGIYCHLRLTRFFENAAYLVNEPHHVPTAMVVSAATKVGTPEGTLARPSVRSLPRTAAATPSAPVIVVAPELRPAPAPRAESDAEGADSERPRFLT